MASGLLNDNQARHITAVLGLLLDDLSELADGLAAALNPGLDQISRALDHLGRLAAETADP